MPIRTNAYQSYKRCILIAQHNGQRDTPFSFYLSHPQAFSQNSLHLSEEKHIFAKKGSPANACGLE